MTEETKVVYDGKFLESGRVSPLLREDVDRALGALEKLALLLIRQKNLRPGSFAIRDVWVVGSVLKGSSKSDIDLYLRTEGTDNATNNILKTNMFYLLCEGSDKSDWIDVYFGTDIPNISGVHAGRPKYRITNQVSDELDRYNLCIGAGRIKLGH